MKHYKLTFLLTLFMSMVGAKTFAHDIEVKNSDGKTIYYTWTNNNTELSVSCKGRYSDSYYHEYEGNVIIPESATYEGTTYPVTGIYETAFRYCSKLTNVTIPNSVTSIGNQAFSMCSALTSVVMPNSITSIGSSVFSSCNSLQKVIVTDIAAWCAIPFNSMESNPLYYAHRLYGDADTEITELIIPNYVASIGDWAFYGCSGLTSVTIPNSVTTIGRGAFQNCSGLTSLSFPNSITSIGSSAFSGCTGLQKVIVTDIAAWCAISFNGDNPLFYVHHLYSDENTEVKDLIIPDGVTSINDCAFAGCSFLTSVTIGNSITSIGGYAFWGCSNLTNVTVKNESPFAIESTTFSYRANATLYVPYGCKSAYESVDYWKEFKEIVEMEPTGVEVADISQLDNVVYVEPTEERTGTETAISFKMKNTAAIRGFQFDLVLPEGVTPVEEEGEYVYWLNADRAPKKAGGQFYHTLEVTKQADGSYRFLCGAQADKTFKGNDGEVAVMKVNIADDMKEGDYPIILRNIKLTETDISNYYQTDEVITKLTVVTYIPGDISGDGIVDVSDYIGVANHILGNTPAGFNARAADVNNDNVIDVSDYIGIANIILTGSIYGNNNAAARLMDKEGEQDPQ